MAGDERWTAATAGLGDPYEWVRSAHDPQVLLEGSGSFVSDESSATAQAPTQLAGGEPPGSPAQPGHFLPPDVVAVPGRRWFTVVDGRGRVDLQFAQWPDPAWSDWYALVLTSHAAPAEHLERLRARRIPYLVVGERRVDLPAAFQLLGELLDVRTIVCTGGVVSAGRSCEPGWSTRSTWTSCRWRSAGGGRPPSSTPRPSAHWRLRPGWNCSAPSRCRPACSDCATASAAENKPGD